MIAVNVFSHSNLFVCIFFSAQLYKEIEICQKITQHIQIEKSDTSSDIYGKLLSFCFYLPAKSVLVCVLVTDWHTWEACCAK